MTSAHARPAPAVSVPVSRLGVAAGTVALAVDGLYLWIIWSQDTPTHLGRVAFVAAAIAAAGASALLGATRETAVGRLPFLGAATGALLSLGYLGLFSIGLPLLVAGGLVAGAWVTTSGAAGPRHPRERAIAIAFSIVGAALPWFGILVT